MSNTNRTEQFRKRTFASKNFSTFFQLHQIIRFLNIFRNDIVCGQTIIEICNFVFNSSRQIRKKLDFSKIELKTFDKTKSKKDCNHE